jgi:arylsulfatase
MWRLQLVAQVIAENVPSFIEYPPMQAGAGFSTGDLKEKVEAAIAAAKANGD